MKSKVFNIIAIIWFFVGLAVWVLFMPFVFLLIIVNMRSIIITGFSTQSIGLTLFALLSFSVGLTMLIPVFRRCFDILPWLYPYLLTSLLNMLILSVGIEILNYGYRGMGEQRHAVYTVLMIFELIVCRGVMCVYFWKRPFRS